MNENNEETQDVISRGLKKMIPKSVDYNDRIRKAMGVNDQDAE